MRFRKRHIWGAVLVALFALPVLRPKGFPALEDPVADFVTWSARTPANPERLIATDAGDNGDDGARVRALRQELAQVWEEHLRYKQAVSGVKAYREALEAVPLARRPKVLVSRVMMAQDAVPSRRSITIDRGAEDGVEVGQPVVMGRVYLGRVHVVRTHSAMVRLVTDPRARLEVFVRTNKDVLLRGYARSSGRSEGKDEMRVEFVRLSDGVGEVEVGSPVFTSNFDSRVPAHLLVGRVSDVDDPDLDRMPTLTLRPALDLDHSTDVLVLLTPDPSREPARRSKQR